jgi:hypothetical protein
MAAQKAKLFSRHVAFENPRPIPGTAYFENPGQIYLLLMKIVQAAPLIGRTEGLHF